MIAKKVAFVLGYEDVGAFRRAFKSWIGLTISEYLKQQKKTDTKVSVLQLMNLKGVTVNTRIQVWCLWSIPAFIISYVIAFVGISQFVPPPSPALSPEEIFAFFDENRFRIRAGQVLAMVFAILYMPWCAVITVQMARVEGRYPVMALLQIVGAAMLTLLFMICSLIWTIAAFRPEQHLQILQMLNDAGWLIFVMAYPEYWMQLGAIAIVFFMDKRPQPFMPRWSCYFTLMVALVGAGGSFATFFKTGPWAWDGILGFWSPVGFYLVWLLVMFPIWLKGVKNQVD